MLSVILAMALAASVIACGGGNGTNPPPPPVGTAAGTTAALRGEIIVSAASSLTDAFNEIKGAYERKEPAARVLINYGASSALAVQVNEGAPVDVFASADAAQMKVVADAGNALEPSAFASNTLVVAHPSNSSTVASFADLAKPGVRVVLAGAAVPAGRYAREALRQAAATGRYGVDFEARVLANVRSEEANVRAVLSKVELGEADAAIVYGTDVASTAGRTRAIALPAEVQVPVAYSITVTKAARQPALARDFVAFVRSAEGQAILARHGFGPVPRA